MVSRARTATPTNQPQPAAGVKRDSGTPGAKPTAAGGTGPARLWQFLGINGTPFVPFPKQLECLHIITIPWPGYRPDGTPAPQVYCVNCGRRWGKSTIGSVILWHGVTAPDDHVGPPTVRMTADTEEHAYKIWDRFTWTATNTPLKALVDSYSKDRELVWFRNGATAQMLSGNNPNALSGDGVTLWVVDESQFVSDASWKNLLPSISDRNGVIVALGVAQGSGYYKTMCTMGDDAHYPEYKRLSYPTSTNPIVSKHALELASRVHTPTEFKQLYLAQWADETGKVFRNVEGCIDQGLVIHRSAEGWGFTEPWRPGHFYYGGIDLARYSDYTTLCLWSKDGKLVAWDRFTNVSWELQKGRLFQLSASYGHPPFRVDSTHGSAGDPIVDDLALLGMNVQPFPLNSHQRKNALVDEHALKIGAHQLSYPNIPSFVREHLLYEAQVSKTGQTIVYGAPSGAHDDWVIGAALGTSQLPLALPLFVREPTTPGVPEDDSRTRAAYEYI